MERSLRSRLPHLTAYPQNRGERRAGTGRRAGLVLLPPTIRSKRLPAPVCNRPRCHHKTLGGIAIQRRGSGEPPPWRRPRKARAFGETPQAEERGSEFVNEPQQHFGEHQQFLGLGERHSDDFVVRLITLRSDVVNPRLSVGWRPALVCQILHVGLRVRRSMGCVFRFAYEISPYSSLKSECEQSIRNPGATSTKETMRMNCCK